METPPALIDYGIQPASAGSHRMMTLFCWAIIIGVVLMLLRLNALGTQLRAAQAPTSTKISPNVGLELIGRTILFNDVHQFGAPNPTATQHARGEALESARKLAMTPADQLDIAILTRESSGIDPANELLRTLTPKLPAGGELRSAADTLTALYGKRSMSVPPADRARLQTQLGWFGRLAATQDLPADSPERKAIISSANRSFAVLIASGILGILALLGGITQLVLLIILFSLGKFKWQYRPVNAPASGRPVFLECFTLWIICYLSMSWTFARLHFSNPLFFEIAFIFVTVAVAMWPLARGVTWPQLREALGWRWGRGILFEMLMGAWGYLAGLPVIALALLLTNLLTKLAHTEASHPAIEEFTAGMPISKLLGLFFALAVGAPLLEETIFRGALYSHLRRRWRPWISAGVVAVVFAGMHPQGWAAIPVLGSIALVLATLREWRGSLIASMTAHAINNGLLVVFLGLSLQ